MTKKITYIGDEPREIPGYGVYKPGDELEYNETLHDTGLFRVIEKKSARKEGEE